MQNVEDSEDSNEIYDEQSDTQKEDDIMKDSRMGRITVISRPASNSHLKATPSQNPL